MVSQPYITGAIKNQIAQGKTSHAYLFTGSRGTGKTTCARIFAKAVNCLNPENGEPCLRCEVCRDAENGALPDIIEIDAASNSRVDDIRELRESVVFAPQSCRFKVYIIDEVHMLSPGAFNALLKTMEEPPPHVRFILATTEVHKVPATIISRCQHFDFCRIKSSDIVKRLLYIASQEGFSLEEEAASIIARLSDGGMRDALSLLDRCSAYSDEITTEIVSSAAGIAGRDSVITLMQSVISGDTAASLRTLDELHSKSKDLKVLCSELLLMLRNLMLIKSTDEARELIACLPEEFAQLSAAASRTSLDRIFECINGLQQTNVRFARTTDKRIELEMCIIKLCAGSRRSEVLTRVPDENPERLDERKKHTADKPESVNNAPHIQTDADQEISEREPDRSQAASPKTRLSPCGEWQEILEIISKRSAMLGAFLKSSAAYIDGSQFYVIVPDGISEKILQNAEHKALLKHIVNEFYEKDFDFRLHTRSSQTGSAPEQGATGDKVSELIERAREMNIEVNIQS